MRNFQIKLALLVFSLVSAGCSEPFIKVIVNGEDISGEEGGCRPPAICGAKRPGGNTGEVVKVGEALAILDDRSKQVEYFMVNDPGVTIEPKDAKLQQGSKVSIERKEGQITLTLK